MQNAPSVVYPLGHSAFYRSALVLLGATAAALIWLGWWTSWLASPWNTFHGLWAFGLVVWAAWAVATWRSLSRERSGSLHWSAQAPPANFDDQPGAWLWRWSDPFRTPVSVRVVPVLDGQRRLLLRVHGVPEVGHWLWFERETNPLRWDDFRRALTAHAVRH
ncbi:hypothetical protein LPB72_04240 [Hydrogenophaga crassostreae]|uniref:Toxin CptA n=1 Tax=Hydrogenophaga crassostreae TaxID=1763535 RepID=A0A167IWW7_9BURK|nr:hypothetical protein [Hydrogenophaga crassostreae]AOW14248.1 hypothetical protein LPB072_16795 [Hydrogenophaga crassostreae]OAD43729.1 hypothetical protein LPB72_04240 [Hydrogenophaga crassostreae]